MYKCILLIRNDIKMSKGKVIAQCGHAIVNMMNDINKKTKKEWMNQGEKIVSVKAPTIDDIYQIQDICKKNKIYSYIVRDAGKTQVNPDTETVCIIGPEKEDILNQFTNHLKLY